MLPLEKQVSICLNLYTDVHTYICTHSTYSVIIECKHCEGMVLFSSPGHDDGWDLLQLPQTLKYRNRLTNELPIRWLLFHSPQLQTHKKGQDEHSQNVLEYHMPNHQGLEIHQEVIFLLSLYLVIYDTVEFSL